MSTGLNLKNVCGVVMLSAAVLCAANANATDAGQTQPHTHTHKKAKAKKPAPPPLPSGPTGPVQQMPLDSIAAVPPQVSFTNNELTIVAPNSTLGDILRAVRKQTGAEIEVPSAPDRVVTHLGPGPAREIIAELLNGSRFNYVLLGAPGNEAQLTRVVLVPKTGVENATPAPAPQADQGMAQAGNPPVPEQDMSQDADAEPADDNAADDGTDQQASEAEQQPPTPPEQQQQPAVKTPQQMLQEMQQRQMQLQQQQQSGQPPYPVPGAPPRPPQEQ